MTSLFTVKIKNAPNGPIIGEILVTTLVMGGHVIYPLKDGLVTMEIIPLVTV